MKHQRKVKSIYVYPVLLIFLTILVNGCAIGTTRIEVTHDPLEPIENKKGRKYIG